VIFSLLSGEAVQIITNVLEARSMKVSVNVRRGNSPPVSGGELSAQFIHTCFGPAYRHYWDRLLEEEGKRGRIR
jgi:hypothetical protein